MCVCVRAFMSHEEVFASERFIAIHFFGATPANRLVLGVCAWKKVQNSKKRRAIRNCFQFQQIL